MRRAKTIDQLYEEVRDYDFVVSNDAALVTALNAMITESRLDGFAFTPKILASMVEGSVLGTRPLTDLEVVEKIEGETGLEFRYIHSEIENIRDIRKYTENVRKYLYSKRAGEVLESYDNCPTTEKVMSIFDSSVYRYNLTGKKVAVIGLDLFNDLDKHMLPQEFDEIDAFVDGEDYEIGTIYGIGNDHQIAGSIVDLIDPETANDTAIILDPNSSVADAVRSALYRRGIHFENKVVMKDLVQVRDYIEFITLALDYRTIRVRDVRELFSVFQKGKNSNKTKELLPKEDKYLLHKIPVDDNTEPVTRMLIETMRKIRECTFSYVAEMLYRGMPQLTSVLMLLKYMKLDDQKITSVLVSRLTYAVNNINDLKHNEQIPEEEKFGVLLADCRNATYVDRSFVIFIGMDESWEVTAPGKEYVDKEKLDEDNAYRLSILLQQGTTRIYAVKPASGGKTTIPCATFLTIFKEDGRPRNIKTFRDICTEYKIGSWYVPATRTSDGKIPVLDAPYDNSWKFSKTSYNAYRDCPVKFMLSELLDGEDNENLLFGNCLHDFAEFYLCYPDLVRENGAARYLGFLEEDYAGISNECQRELDLSKFRVYANNLMKYIDYIRPAQVPLDIRNDSRKYPNRLIEMEGLSMCSSLAEGRMECDDPLFSKMDLCIGNLICDYKTGKTMELTDIVKKFTDKGDYHDFQALIYLAVLAANTDDDCEFDLFYIGANDIKSVTGDYDVRDSVRKVVYVRKRLADILMAQNSPLMRYVENTKAVAKFYDNWANVYDTLYEVIDDRSVGSEASVNALLDAAGLPGNVTNTKNARSLANKAALFVNNGYQIIDDSIVVAADVMDDFLTRLRKDREVAGEELLKPVYKLDKGTAKCKNCGFSNVCLKNDSEEEDA